MKFDAPHFKDELLARRFIEALRWEAGRHCPKCGSADSYETKREGRYRCSQKECRADFTVTTGTVMESSHIRLTVWLMAMYLMSASKKGMSAHQLHRSLGVTYKTAWFLAHRIRLAMANGGLLPPMGGEGKIVEADETYYGKPAEPKPVPRLGNLRNKRLNRRNDRPIIALVERGGKVRTFHVATADKATVAKIVMDNVDPKSRLHTDESRLYTGADQVFATHETVKHSAKEYARGDVHTNSAEGYFGVFKKGMKGVYQHCSEKHLHRYLAEFDFRHNTRDALGVSDGERAALAVKGVTGKRLTYRHPH